MSAGRTPRGRHRWWRARWRRYRAPLFHARAGADTKPPQALQIPLPLRLATLVQEWRMLVRRAALLLSYVEAAMVHVRAHTHPLFCARVHTHVRAGS